MESKKKGFLLFFLPLSFSLLMFAFLYRGFPCGSGGKESTCTAEDLGLIPGSGRSPGEGNGYPLQYSCLENSIVKRDLQATVHGVTE